jgi:hypothetical protein
VLQKSQKALRLIFCQGTKQATIADQWSLRPVTEIACEFFARRRSPPHYYSIVAPTARRIELLRSKAAVVNVMVKRRDIDRVMYG